MSQKDFSLLENFTDVLKERKLILYSLLCVAFLSAIVSLCLPVYYKSLTSFYAASPDLGLPNSVSTTELQKFIYGSDYDIDRVLAIGNSEAIYSFLIERFDLYNHYDIDTSNRKAPYYVREELKDRYKIIKTKLGSIELTVEDTDAQFAAQMANEARTKIDEISQKLVKDSQMQTLKSYKANEVKQLALAGSLSDSLSMYKKKFNIIDTKSQGEVLSEIVSTTKADLDEVKAMLAIYKETGKRDSIAKFNVKVSALEKKYSGLKEELNMFTDGKSKVIQLEYEYDRLIGQIALDGQRKSLLEGAYASPFTALHVIEVASPSVVKSKPKRALIVIVSTMLAGLLSIAYILLKNGILRYSNSL